MGIFSEIVRSWRKSTKLQRLESIIGSTSTLQNMLAGKASAEDYFTASQAKDRAFEEFLDLCEGDPNVKIVMHQFGASRDSLREVYVELLRNGAGQWVKGHFVAASALAYAPSLAYCLKSRVDGTPDQAIKVAYAMLKYFRGSPLGQPGA